MSNMLQKLEKDKAKWHKQAQLRQKEREAKLKALHEVELAKIKAKAAAEEEVLR